MHLPYTSHKVASDNKFCTMCEDVILATANTQCGRRDGEARDLSLLGDCIVLLQLETTMLRGNRWPNVLDRFSHVRESLCVAVLVHRT